MTDQHSAQLHESSENESSEELGSFSSNLVFPRLDLKTSFEALLDNSEISTPSSTMAGHTRGPSSLTESWASISDAELSVDDDLQSEHTDLGSLIDLHSTGDVQSVRDEETSSEALETETDEEDEDIIRQQDSTIRHPIETPLASSKTGETRADGEHLTLDETWDAPAGESVITEKIVKTFSENECRTWKIPREPEFVGKMRMPVGRFFISDTQEPAFRVLFFHPEIPNELLHAILCKLADAQLASGSGVDINKRSTSSRYHIVPDAIGPGSQPAAAAIVPVDRQLETVHYETATFDPELSRTICLGDSTNPRRTMSIWECSSSQDTGSYHVYGAQMEEPNLAIVLVDNQKVAKNREFARASLAFARRHRIPAIAIRLHDDWLSDPALSGFIEDDMHIAVQATSSSDDPIIRTLPIDADMFLTLNPGQLSRHIRYLMQRYTPVPEPPRSTGNSSIAKHTDIEKNMQHTELLKPKQSPPFMRLLILAVSVLVLFHGLVAFQMRWSQTRPSLALENEIIDSVKTNGDQLPPLSMVSVAPPKDVAIATMEVPRSTAGRQLAPKKKFEVEVVGASNLVIRSAREFRVQDPLQVSISRQGKPVKANVRELFPSVWSVQVEPDQAYGELCVQLSMRRPAINESALVSMGEQPFDAWFKNLLGETEEHIQQKLALLQDSLENIQREQRPQNFAKNVQARFSALIEKVDHTLRAPELQDRALELKHAFLKQMEYQVASANVGTAHVVTELKKVARMSRDQTDAVMMQLEDNFGRVRAALEDVRIPERLTAVWRTVQERPKSETLAKAQERAQRVVDGVRERLTKQ